MSARVALPDKPNDPAYQRLLLFPLALSYVAALALAAWPRQLTVGATMERLQLAATHALAQLAVLPSVNVFSGRTHDRTATLRTCFRISGYTGGPGEAQRVILYDSMDRCERGLRPVVKDNYEFFHDQHLRRGLEHLNTPGATLDRNQPPLSFMFAIADYHCHRDPEHEFSHLLVTSRHQRRHLDSGEPSDVTTVEGAHHCRDGGWEPIRAQKPEGAPGGR